MLTETSYSIKRCEYSDLEAVMDVNELMLPEHYPKFFYERLLEKFGELFLIAKAKDHPNEVVAYVMWRIERGPSFFKRKYIKKAHLVSLAVMRDYHRMNIASQFMRHCMKTAAETFKVDEYLLEVRVSNYAAIKLYENFGFERTKIIENYYRDGEDSYTMCRAAPKKGYVPGSKAMLPSDIKRFYQLRDMNGMVFLCPSCEYVMVKNLAYVNNSRPKQYLNTIRLPCPNCKEILAMSDIMAGEYDL